MSSPFGWSYPPGCSGPPEHDESCQVCGAYDVDQCVCPECPECGGVGDPSCYESHGMVRTPRQIDLFASRMAREEAQAKAEADWLANFAEEEREYFDALEEEMKKDYLAQ